MKHILIVISLVIFIQCKNIDKNKLLDDIPSYYPLENSTLIDSIDTYIDSIHLIKLKTGNDKYIKNAIKMLITNDGCFVILCNDGISKYNKDGVFINNIGAIGRGTGEYVKIYDIAINFEHNELFALDNVNQVLRYNLNSGEYIGKIKTTQKKSPGNFEAISPKKGGGFYLFTCNPADVEDFKNDYYCLYEFNEKGEIINKYLKRIDFVFTQGIITQSNHNQYIIRPQEGDNICYQINSDTIGIVPKYRLDFKTAYAPQKHIFSFDGEFGNKFYLFLRSDYYKIPLYIQETNDLLFFSTVGPGCKPVDFVINKSSGNGIRWAGGDNEPAPFYFQCSDEQYFYGLYSDYRENHEFADDDSVLKKFLVRKKKMILNLNSEPYILKIKFKNIL